MALESVAVLEVTDAVMFADPGCQDEFFVR